MKRIKLSLCSALFIVSQFSFAQEASVEKSVWGIQIGIPPLAIYNESRISNTVSIRSELWAGFGVSSNYTGGSSYAIFPVLALEPRFYHNLKRRLDKGTDISDNSANYISINLSYEPGIGAKSEDVTLHPAISIIPMYGIKRKLATHLNLEFAFGVGYGWQFKSTEYYTDYTFTQTETYKETTHGVSYGIRAAIGYVF